MGVLENISACANYLGEIDAEERTRLFEKLFKERVNVKRENIMRTYKEVGEDWNQTLYTLLLKYLGSTHNGNAMEQLSRVVTYNMIAKERGALLNIEALLLGGAGLLELYSEDSYIRALKEEFTHLRAKYNITPLCAEVWRLHNIYPNTHPTLRLVQFAASVHKQALSFAAATECRTRKDVHTILSGAASEYWLENFAFGANVTASAHIGAFTNDLLGINVIIPILIANGVYMEDSELISHAFTLAKNIPAEDNRYIKMWQNSASPIAISAIDSQALLHLHRTYCENKLCKACFVWMKRRGQL
ncbi:MAG: DUF2851 family protein [Alistipes sp.]|nr:DUF2851 family protein [Alistipes sp.]